MKKYLAVVLALCLLLCVCACSGDKAADAEQASSSGEVIDTEQVSSVVDYSTITADTLDLYISTDLALDSSGSSETGTTMASIVKRRAEQYDIGYVGLSPMTVSDVSKKQEFEISGEKFEFEYRGSQINSLKTEMSPYNRRYDSYGYYKNGKNIAISCLGKTNKIVDYNNMTDVQKWQEGDPIHDKQELSVMAESFLLSVMSKEEYEKFVPRALSLPADFRQRYGLYYDRYVHGYQTDESMYVIIDQSKKIVSYNIMSCGKFDELENKFTKEHVDAVVAALQDKIENTVTGEDALISEPMLTTDIYGGLYVAIQIRYESTLIEETVYAKVG